MLAKYLYNKKYLYLYFRKSHFKALSHTRGNPKIVCLKIKY